MQINYKQGMPAIFILTILVGLAFVVYTRLNFDFNGGHMDEYDYLFVGRRLLSGEGWNTYFYIFGANFNWYLLGLGDYLGGLTGARLVAAGFGVLSLIGSYWFIFTLWQVLGYDKPSSSQLAALNVCILSFHATHIYISRFATYDIIALAFFSLSLAPLLKACRSTGRQVLIYLGLAIVLFALAVMSKYIIIAYFPVLILLALYFSPPIALIFTIVVGSILAFYANLHWHDLQDLYKIQIKGTHGANASYYRIGQMEFLYLVLPISLWVLALAWRVYELKQQQLSLLRDGVFYGFLVLLVLALPLVAYHLHGRNMISLYKHMVYAAFFLSPVIAWLLWSLLKHFAAMPWVQLLPASIVAGIVILNTEQLRDMEHAYPDVRPVMAWFAQQNLPPDTTIASEDPYSLRYAVFDHLSQAHIQELGWMDNNRDGKSEKKDVVEALWDNKFTYVFLNNLIHTSLNKDIRGLLAARGYEKVMVIPWHTTQVMSTSDQGELELYKRTHAPRIPTNEDAMFQ